MTVYVAGHERERLRGGASIAEVLAIEIDERAGRVGRDVEERDARPDALERFLDARLDGGVGLALERALVVAVRVRELTQVLVRARDVEHHVAVAHEAVRREEVRERAL